MESLDAMSQVLKLTGKVIKPVLVGTGKATKIIFKVTKAFLQPGVKFTKLNGRLLSVLIPIPVDLTPNLEAAINKAKELLANNKEAFDLEVQLKKDAQGVEIKDQNGNLVGEIEVDGEKIEVLVNTDESKLKESAEEIVTIGSSLSKILKNDDFRKVYEDLVSGVTPRRFAKELSIEEEAIYRFYTNESYYKFNQALILENHSDDILELEKLLNKTLDKISSSPGTYFRGIGKNEIEILEKLKINEEITYKNFLSTSMDRSYAGTVARKNMEKTGRASVIIVESKNGKNIVKYSDLEREAEILHKSGGVFILRKVEDDVLLNVYEHQFEYYPAVRGKVFTIIEK